MRKILLVLALLIVSAPVIAQHRHSGHPHYHQHRHSHNNWVAPAIIAGTLGYLIAREQNPVIIHQYNTPYYVQQPQPVCWEIGHYTDAWGRLVRQYQCQ